jgi:hypothetical protein
LTRPVGFPILAAMFLIPFVTEPIGGNGAKVYRCGGCGSLITLSDQRLTIEGKSRHSFVNPSGIEFDFHSFSSCSGAIALGDATEAHTWFAGYRWRIALCRTCGLHMGWHYEALFRSERPREFWGILVANLVAEG